MNCTVDHTMGKYLRSIFFSCFVVVVVVVVVVGEAKTVPKKRASA